MSAFASKEVSEQPNVAESRNSELVERIRRGERTAIEELYAKVSRGLKFLIGRQLPPQDIDDAVQDTFMAVVQGIQRNGLSNPECLTGYVRTVMQRQVAERVNTLATRRSRDVDLAAAPDEPSDLSYTPEQRLMMDENVAIMHTVLDALPDRYREVLTRFYVLEQEPQQIMAEMRLSPTQFRLIKSRAKAQFSARGRLLHSSGALPRAGRGDRA